MGLHNLEGLQVDLKDNELVMCHACNNIRLDFNNPASWSPPEMNGTHSEGVMIIIDEAIGEN